MSANSDLVTKVSVGKYDQVFALTQQMINMGFANLWLKHQGDVQKNKVTVKNRGGSMENVVFDAPQVIISADPMNFSQVAYRLWFLEGRLKVYTSSDGDNTTDIDMAGWYFTFMVNIGLAGLDPKSDDYKRISGIVNAPGDHSITQLLVDMNTADISNYRKDLSKFNNTVFTGDTLDNFATLISKTLTKDLRDKFTATLGYQVNMKTISDSAKATFLPTDVRFQTYPWTDAANPTGKAGDTGTSRLNYLCYLETTADSNGNAKTPPSGSDVVLPIVGNWTEGVPDGNNNFDKVSLGSFVQSRSNFLEGWLLKKLAIVNYATEAYVSDLNVGCRFGDTVFTFTWDWNVNLEIGGTQGRSSGDTYFDWKSGGDQKYTWSSSYDLGTKDDVCGSKGAPLVHLWGSAKCNTNNTLQWVPGTSRITITGNSFVELYKSLKNLTTNDDTLRYTNTWTIDLDLQAVKDGGLQIKTTIGEPVASKDYNKDDGDMDGYQSYLESSYSTAMSNFSRLEKALADDIGMNNKFVFPAGGVFFFKNPVLTKNGDIACEISYNGVPEQQYEPNQSAADRANIVIQPDQQKPSQPSQLSGSGSR